MRAKLFCRTGELAGKTHQLAGDTVIGRGSDADVVLPSSLISARHARIYVQEGAFFLEDLGSANGTWLDGMRIRKPERLDYLNVITFAGSIDFVFQMEEAGSEAPAPEPEEGEAEPVIAEVEDDHRTELDLDDFTPLPELEQPGAEPVGEPAGGPLEGDSTSDTPDDDHRTQVDFEDFTPLPELEEPGPAEPAREPAGGPSAEKVSETPPADEEAHTRVDMNEMEPLPELEPEGPQRYGLEVVFPDGHHESFELTEGRHTLGRSSKCDIRLNDRSISRHHATVTVGETVILEDAESRNGTQLEGRRIREAEIHSGSVFTLGPEVEVRLVKR